MSPRLRVSWEAANPGVEDLRLVVTLAGPVESGYLDDLTGPGPR
jgi:hypothetical protein